jgi:hypothetical protein
LFFFDTYEMNCFLNFQWSSEFPERNPAFEWKFAEIRRKTQNIFTKFSLNPPFLEEISSIIIKFSH